MNPAFVTRPVHTVDSTVVVGVVVVVGEVVAVVVVVGEVVAVEVVAVEVGVVVGVVILHISPKLPLPSTMPPKPRHWFCATHSPFSKVCAFLHTKHAPPPLFGHSNSQL